MPVEIDIEETKVGNWTADVTKDGEFVSTHTCPSFEQLLESLSTLYGSRF